MDLGQWIMIGLSLVLAGWFAGGFVYNRRRGEFVSRWMMAGMKCLGEISEIAWIGSSASGARIVVKEARSPFRQVEAIFLLESREILPIWLFNRLLGKQDEAIIKADLCSAPKEVIEVIRRNHCRKTRRHNDANQRDTSSESIVNGFQILPSEKSLARDFSKISSLLEIYGSGVRKISIHRKRPHLIVRLNLPTLLGKPAEAVFQALQEIFC